MIYDLNDDGLFLDAYGRANVRVHDNVVLKTLTALNFASDKKGPVETVGGPFFIYRNLIDLRERTPGFRPEIHRRHQGLASWQCVQERRWK